MTRGIPEAAKAQLQEIAKTPKSVVLAADYFYGKQKTRRRRFVDFFLGKPTYWVVSVDYTPEGRKPYVLIAGEKTYLADLDD